MSSASTSPPTPSGIDGNNWALVAVAGMLSFVAMLDMSIVNVALDNISRNLDMPPETAQWAVLGYQLPVVALLLPAGRWLDGVGLRSALVTSVTMFALCSISAALAAGPGWLIASRIGQGLFGAVLFVLMPVLAARAVCPEQRGLAMSVPATFGPLGAVTGPALGGVLLDSFGWRAIFLVKIPVCVAALVITWLHAPRGHALTVPDRRSVVDAALIGTATALVLLALTFATASLGWLALATLAVVPLTGWLRGAGGRPVLAMLRESGTHRVNAAVLCMAIGFAAMIYLVALRLQRYDGVSASATGLTVLAFSLAMALVGPVGGRLADLWGARRTAVTGVTITALGLLLLLTLGESWSPLEVAWRLALAGIGMGLYGGPSQLLVMTAAPPQQMATAGSTVQLARSLGFTLGPALATVAWGAGGGGQNVMSGLGLAAGATCLAIPLLAFRGRSARHSSTQPAPDASPHCPPQPTG